MKWLLLGLFILLQGCSSMKVDDYVNETPKLDLFEFFSGKTAAWGQFQDRSGKVIKRFQVDIHGEIKQGRLILDEQFVYSDGTKEQRIWTIEKISENEYRGTAGDVEGEAIGLASGNALNWRYTLRLPYNGSTLNVNLDDWMFLNTETTMINRAKMTKFGFELGEVTLFFQKEATK